MSERVLMNEACKYLKNKGYLFYGDYAAGMYLSMIQARLISRYRSGSGLPDIVVFHRTNDYVGFAFELKKQSPYKKNGQLKKNQHLYQQNEVLKKLRSIGWYAEFIWDLEQIKKVL